MDKVIYWTSSASDEKLSSWAAILIAVPLLLERFLRIERHAARPENATMPLIAASPDEGDIVAIPCFGGHVSMPPLSEMPRRHTKASRRDISLERFIDTEAARVVTFADALPKIFRPRVQ